MLVGETKLPLVYEQVKHDGTVSLMFDWVLQAAGKRPSDLERIIRDHYVPKKYIDLTVTVRISPDAQFIYVDGEFKKSGRYPWTDAMRLSDAIEGAGGFTVYANHRIKLIHLDGTNEKFRLVGDWVRTNNPALRPGDKIYNPRNVL